jgi:ABC-type uncharacterized transport system ATPase subunit
MANSAIDPKGQAPKTPVHGQILLEARGLSKGFPGVWQHLILDHLDFDVRAGEVHTLLGENGAGKTVIANILSGYYGKTNGEIRVKGKLVSFDSPRDGLAHGIAMVHQDLMLVGAFTVAQNVMVGLKAPPFSFRLHQVERKLDELVAHYGLQVDPRARVEDLSAGEQQRVEILKVLFHEPEVLFLDEPTSLLAPHEADQLFVVLRAMADEGKGIVFISHKMREVFAVSDRVTVLKLGKMQGTCHISETTEDELTRRTFGESVPEYMERPAVRSDKPAIKVSHLIPQGLEKKSPKAGLSFTLRQGEILGLAGVSGNGQSELIASLTGLAPPASGQIIILGEDMTKRSPRAFIEKGVAHIPERRRQMGIVEQMFVAENVVLKDYRQTPFSRNTVLNHHEITTHAQDIVSRFNALVPDLWDTECRILSGGNIQRLILGRETWRKPPVIIASHPTEGLDAKAIRHTWDLFLELREQGSGILLISEDLDEIMSLSDRIGVMSEGAIVGVVEGQDADRELLGHWMTGTGAEAA